MIFISWYEVSSKEYPVHLRIRILHKPFDIEPYQPPSLIKTKNLRCKSLTWDLPRPGCKLWAAPHYRITKDFLSCCHLQKNLPLNSKSQFVSVCKFIDIISASDILFHPELEMNFTSAHISGYIICWCIFIYLCHPENREKRRTLVKATQF